MTDIAASETPPVSTWVVADKLWENSGRYYRVVATNPDGMYRGELLVPWSEARPTGLILMISALSAALGTFLGVAIAIEASSQTRFGADAPSAVPYTQAQLSAPYLRDETRATKIELVIEAPEKIRAVSPHAYAYAYPTTRPCRIVIPTGMQIDAAPSQAEAQWTNRSDGDVLAHEILHCLRGKWHPKAP